MTQEAGVFVYIYLCVRACVCVWGACLSELSMKSDPISSTRAKGTFMETVEDRNKVVVGSSLKQNTAWAWTLKSRSRGKSRMKFLRQLFVGNELTTQNKVIFPFFLPLSFVLWQFPELRSLLQKGGRGPGKEKNSSLWFTVNDFSFLLQLCSLLRFYKIFKVTL